MFQSWPRVPVHLTALRPICQLQRKSHGIPQHLKHWCGNMSLNEAVHFHFTSYIAVISVSMGTLMYTLLRSVFPWWASFYYSYICHYCIKGYVGVHIYKRFFYWLNNEYVCRILETKVAVCIIMGAEMLLHWMCSLTLRPSFPISSGRHKSVV